MLQSSFCCELCPFYTDYCARIYIQIQCQYSVFFRISLQAHCLMMLFKSRNWQPSTFLFFLLWLCVTLNLQIIKYKLRLPKLNLLSNIAYAQRARGLSSAYQSNLVGHITGSNKNLDQISSSEFRLRINFLTKHQH